MRCSTPRNVNVLDYVSTAAVEQVLGHNKVWNLSLTLGASKDVNAKIQIQISSDVRFC